eukprot:2870344-Rhodomonas_salina.1
MDMSLVVVAIATTITIVLTERVLNVLLTLMIVLVFDSDDAALYPAMLTVGSFVSIFTELFASVGRALVNLLSNLLAVLVVWVIVFLAAASLFLVYEQNPVLVRHFGEQWNT